MKQKGSITIFLSMMFLLILSLVCMLIESTRVTSVVTRANQISYIALDSTFSAYAREVFEDYGIMILWKDESEIRQSYEEYVENNLKPSFYGIKEKDLYGIHHQSTVLQEQVVATDGDGEYIANQIYDYMKYSISEDVIQQLLGKCESLEENEDVQIFYDDLEECNEILNNIETDVGKISTYVEQIHSFTESPKEVMENMKQNLESIVSVQGEDDYSRQVRDDYFRIYMIYFRKYHEWQSIASEGYQGIMEYTEHYKNDTNLAQEFVSQMKENIEIMEMNGLDQELVDTFWEETNELDEEILSKENDIYQVYQNETYSRMMNEKVEKVMDAMQPVIEENEELEYSGNYLSNYDNKDEFIKNTYECVCSAIKELEGYSDQSIFVNYQKPSGKKKKSELVEFVKKIKRDGLLGYVSVEQISDKKISLDQMPSHTSTINYGRAWKNRDAKEESIRKVLQGQYILDKFHSYTNCQKGALEYEIEYILKGQESDQQNLEQVIMDIVNIRVGFNLIYLLKNEQKKTEAYELAVSLVGVSGMPVLIRATQFLILGAWAYAESVVDVKDLLKGQGVKLWKEDADWHLSLQRATELQTEEQKDDKKKEGLCYEDYLRMMLFTQNKSEQVYRIMDMIQLQVREQYNPEFQMNQGMIRMKVSTTYSCQRLFSAFGETKRYIYDRKKGLMFTVTEEISY